MARYILKDKKYTKDPVVFETYKDMIERVQAISREKKEDFSKNDEKSLEYDIERLLD